MTTKQVLVPQLGESVVEATVGPWQKQEGDAVKVGDVLVELQTDKVDVEVGAEAAGVLLRIERREGEDVAIGDVLAEIEVQAAVPSDAGQQPAETVTVEDVEGAPSQPAGERVTPVARRMAEHEEVALGEISGTGPDGRITKRDVADHLQQRETPTAPAPQETSPVPPLPDVSMPAALHPAAPDPGFRREVRERMSRRRRTIARRLLEAQQTAAMLTTFNEIDMSAVVDLRKRRQEQFVARHGVKLGFMSFFVKASIGALKAFPNLNAEIQDDEIVRKFYYDIGMAVGAEDGLVVPVLRDADRLSFAEIERQIKELAEKAQSGGFTLEELRGGTFTITNGGVFGSMLSTPILNPPQVGILGLHRIQERPVVISGEIVVRPIMYVALSYDHRIVDGREAVQFLVRVKELVEEPDSLLLDA
jgi:2-oxoglutarate dehydrogenase E2 component (dihydrolipoamide succinyltransferase)